MSFPLNYESKLKHNHMKKLVEDILGRVISF